MHVRVSRLIVDPGSIDSIAEGFEAAGLAEPRTGEGFLGCGLYARRETGEIAEITVWESARALAASERGAVGWRAEAAGPRFRLVDVARLELAWRDRTAQDWDSAFVRVDVGSLPVDRLDAFASFVVDGLAPHLRELAGYRGGNVGLERTAGIVTVTTEWRTEVDRAAANPAFAPVLQRAAEFDLQPLEIQLWERPQVRR